MRNKRNRLPTYLVPYPLLKKYSQLEKEAFPIISVSRNVNDTFHWYVIGRLFTIESDHQPLKSLFGETNKNPQMASSRTQR